MVISIVRSDYLIVRAVAFIVLICGFEPNDVYIKENISYIEDKPIDLIPIMLFVGKMVACYTSKVTNTLYN